MRSRYEAFLNDIALSSISADLQVLDISYAVPSIKNVTYTVAKRDGQRVARRYTDQASVTITFELHIYDTVKRQAACQNVAAWAAKGGVLRTSDRMGQQLTCICTTMPTITSAMRWNDALAVTFTAFPYPYWQAITPSTLTLTGTTNEGTLYVAGSAESAYVEAQITANAQLSTIALTAGDRTLTLSGLSIPQGGVIRLYYDADGIQHITYGNVSLLNKRTGADDLTAKCGEYNAMSYTANAAVECVFIAKGAWL